MNPPPDGSSLPSGTPLVSVVIPTARGGRYLREAVDSVRAQSLPDWELIVVADGCRDNLADLSRNDGRISVVRQARRGVAVARNVGVRCSRAPLVAFLDDDDRMLPDRLARQLNAMRDDRVGLCHTWWQVIDGHGAVVDMTPFVRARSGDLPQYEELLRGEAPPPITTAIVCKELFLDVGGFDATLSVCEDFDLIFRIACESRLHVVKEVLTEYRRHDAGTLPVGRNSDGEELTSVFARHLCRAQFAGRPEHVRAARQGLAAARRRRARRRVQLVREALAAGRCLYASRLLGHAVRTAPAATGAALMRATAVGAVSAVVGKRQPAKDGN